MRGDGSFGYYGALVRINVLLYRFLGIDFVCEGDCLETGSQGTFEEGSLKLQPASSRVSLIGASLRGFCYDGSSAMPSRDSLWKSGIKERSAREKDDEEMAEADKMELGYGSHLELSHMPSLRFLCSSPFLDQSFHY